MTILRPSPAQTRWQFRDNNNVSSIARVCMCGALALPASIRNHQCSNSLLRYHSNSIFKADVMALVRLLGHGVKCSLAQQSLTPGQTPFICSACQGWTATMTHLQTQRLTQRKLVTARVGGPPLQGESVQKASIPFNLGTGPQGLSPADKARAAAVSAQAPGARRRGGRC
jgi:hypothetical protein